MGLSKAWDKALQWPPGGSADLCMGFTGRSGKPQSCAISVWVSLLPSSLSSHFQGMSLAKSSLTQVSIELIREELEWCSDRGMLTEQHAHPYTQILEYFLMPEEQVKQIKLEVSLS